MDLLGLALVDELRLHPRLLSQGELRLDRAARERLRASVPALLPFGGRRYAHLVALLDWDHRLPSRRFTLRLHACYEDASRRRFDQAFADREAEIRAKDLFPEFDVPDFAELPADETYEAEVSLELKVEALRLTSAWRREIAEDVGAEASRVVRESSEFERVRAAESTRPAFLGELEAVGWSPPCETGHARWAVDVWWLTAFDGRNGKGWSFFVDVSGSRPRVVGHREFSVRTG